MLGAPAGVEGDANELFKDALTGISTAEGIRSDAYGELAKNTDEGQMRPSQVASLKEGLSSYQEGLADGWLKYGHAAVVAGVPIAELNLKPAS